MMHPPPSSSDATAPPAGDSLRIYEQIFRTAADALIIVDRSGHIQLANKQAELLFGLPPERLAGLALEAPRTHELLNASLNRIAWQDESFALLAWADAAHLVEAIDDAAQARGHP